MLKPNVELAARLASWKEEQMAIARAKRDTQRDTQDTKMTDSGRRA